MFRLYLYILAFCLHTTILWSQNNALLPIKVNHKWGYIDGKARIVIMPEYEFAEDFKDSAFAVTVKSGKSGLINRQGKVVIKHIYDNVELLTSGYFLIQKDSLQGIADGTGEIVYNCLADDI